MERNFQVGLIINSKLGKSLKIQETNVVGEPIGSENAEIHFEPWGVKFIKIRIE